MSVLGRALKYWRERENMTHAQLAECLIHHGYRDPGFTTASELTNHLVRIEAGDPWPLGPTERLFIECIRKCLGPDAAKDVAIGIADDILHREFQGDDDFGLGPITPDR